MTVNCTNPIVIDARYYSQCSSIEVTKLHLSYSKRSCIPSPHTLLQKALYSLPKRVSSNGQREVLFYSLSSHLPCIFTEHLAFCENTKLFAHGWGKRKGRERTIKFSRRRALFVVSGIKEKRICTVNRSHTNAGCSSLEVTYVSHLCCSHVLQWSVSISHW